MVVTVRLRSNNLVTVTMVVTRHSSMSVLCSWPSPPYTPCPDFFPSSQQGPPAPQDYPGGGGGYNSYPPQIQHQQYDRSRQQQYGQPHAPSTAPQSFGHGAPNNYSFQYSNCTGRRKALVIGINYYKGESPLKGCINDAHRISNFLSERYGYNSGDMVILFDNQYYIPGQPPRELEDGTIDPRDLAIPTRKNILNAMHWLVRDARPNDSLFFHYSGHGTQRPDEDGDEDDGFDEVICPVDHKLTDVIVDDLMHEILVKSLPAGCRLTAIFDSCHSGSALDLPFIYSTQGVLKEPNLAKEAGMGIMSMVSDYARGNIGGMAGTAMSLFKKATRGGDAERVKQTKSSPADVIMWSGSKDGQTSRDAKIGREYMGAMTFAFVEALTKNPHQSYVQLLNSIRDEMEGKYTQKPQLSSSHPIGKSELLIYALSPSTLHAPLSTSPLISASSASLLKIGSDLRSTDTDLLFVL
jgi:metacaspase-1